MQVLIISRPVTRGESEGFSRTPLSN